jgi:hypothetical protein
VIEPVAPKAEETPAVPATPVESGTPNTVEDHLEDNSGAISNPVGNEHL